MPTPTSEPTQASFTTQMIWTSQLLRDVDDRVEELTQQRPLTDQEQKQLRRIRQTTLNREIDQRNAWVAELHAQQLKNNHFGPDWGQAAGRFASCTLDSFNLHGTDQERAEQQRIIGELRKIDINAELASGCNLLFIGPCGTGKDHMMFSLLRLVFESLTKVECLNGADLRREARAARRGDTSEEALIHRLANCDLLCLSDPIPPGGAALTESQADILYDIIEHRSQSYLPTWATLNLPTGTLKESATRALSAQVWDRLKYQAILVPCRWESYRTPERVL